MKKYLGLIFLLFIVYIITLYANQDKKYDIVKKSFFPFNTSTQIADLCEYNFINPKWRYQTDSLNSDTIIFRGVLPGNSKVNFRGTICTIKFVVGENDQFFISEKYWQYPQKYITNREKVYKEKIDKILSKSNLYNKLTNKNAKYQNMLVEINGEWLKCDKKQINKVLDKKNLRAVTASLIKSIFKVKEVDWMTEVKLEGWSKINFPEGSKRFRLLPNLYEDIKSDFADYNYGLTKNKAYLAALYKSYQITDEEFEEIFTRTNENLEENSLGTKAAANIKNKINNAQDAVDEANKASQEQAQAVKSL